MRHERSAKGKKKSSFCTLLVKIDIGHFSANIGGYFEYLLIIIISRLACLAFSFLAATGVGIFSGIPQPCIRAQMSKMVDKNEQGTA